MGSNLRFCIDFELEQRLHGIIGVDVTSIGDTIGHEIGIEIVSERVACAGVQKRLDETRSDRILDHRDERVGLLDELFVNRFDVFARCVRKGCRQLAGQ